MKCTLVVDVERIKTVPYDVDDHHSLSSSSSDTLETLAFLHAVPLQLPQAKVHERPFFLQLHRRLLQSVVQPHLMTLSRSSGAGSKSVWIGISPNSVVFQPQATGCISLLQPIH